MSPLQLATIASITASRSKTKCFVVCVTGYVLRLAKVCLHCVWGGYLVFHAIHRREPSQTIGRSTAHLLPPAKIGGSKILRGRRQTTGNPFFCFEQALIAFSFSQKFLAFRSRFIFFCRLNFSGDRLIQFIDGPMRNWLSAHDGFLAVADKKCTFTGCPTFTRQKRNVRSRVKICLSDSAGQLPPFLLYRSLTGA